MTDSNIEEEQTGPITDEMLRRWKEFLASRPADGGMSVEEAMRETQADAERDVGD